MRVGCMTSDVEGMVVLLCATVCSYALQESDGCKTNDVNGGWALEMHDQHECSAVELDVDNYEGERW